ncbi:MAG: phytoene desaturase family protein [Propionibacteriaceae bacterium]|nr:phytoene desaturase family protein [Propionibacteriaceae bacterium]
MNVLVIGAGLSGLSAALHLRGQGHQVTVLEREAVPGGRSGRIERDGFTFDSGPTVFTMVDLLDQAFRAVGRRADDYVAMQLLDPAYRACFADGSTLHVRHGVEAMRAEIARECGSVDAAAYEEFVVWLRKLYLAELPHFIDVNFDNPADLLRNPVAAARLVALGGFGRLGPTIERRFADPRLHRIFSFQAMYAGLAPAQALALYAVNTYMDGVVGVWYPGGGWRGVPDAMALAASDAGVAFRYETTVDRITSAHGRATGVRLSGGEHVRADAVVCTLDLPIAYDELLPEVPQPRVAARGRYSPSCVVWHLGVRGAPPAAAAHHNIHFGQVWHDAFDDLLRRGRPMADPSRFVAVPSLHDQTAAPDGCTSLYVLEPTPNLAVGKLDWSSEGPRLRDRMLGDLQRWGYPTDIVTEQLVTPADWLAQGMAAGTPFALAHTFGQTGPFRAKNVDKRVQGLVFAGSSTTPGVGIPMVLISGKLAAQRVGAMTR